MKHLAFTLLIVLATTLLHAQPAPESDSDTSVLHSLMPRDADPQETKPRPGDLLDEVLANPGAWNQMCSIILPPSPRHIPLFGYVRQPMYFISTSNFERLRTQRDGVVNEIRARLADRISTERDKVRGAIERLKSLEGETTATPEQTRVVVSGFGDSGDSSALDSYLMILLDLNGTEALPGLLKLEAALDEIAIYRSASELWKELGAADRSDPRLSAAYGAIRAHAHLLSVITALLRNECYAPFLDSDIYQQYTNDYAALLESRAGNAGYFSLSAEPEAMPPEDPQLVLELVHLRDRDAARLDGKLSVPYSETTRDTITGLAKRFLEEIPPSDFVAADAMTSTPSRR